MSDGMAEIDAALSQIPVSAPTLSGAAGKRCRRHEWARTIADGMPWPARCTHCGLTTRDWDPEMVPEDRRCLRSPSTVHEAIEYPYCRRCGAIRDEARARRGKSARSRGNAYERELAKKLGGKRTGQYGGPDDVTVSDLFTIQSKVRKAWPQWMADELAKLPRVGGRIPLLVVANAPGSAFRRQALVVVELGDWISLHGPVAQRDSLEGVE